MDAAVTASATNTNQTWRVERLNPNDDMVRRAWRRLQAQGAICTPFLTHEWCSALADVPGACDGFQVLAVCSGDRLIGLFPLEWMSIGRRLTMLGPAGWRWLAPDHLDVIATPTDRARVAHAIAQYVARSRDWDIADFQGLKHDGALTLALRTALRPPRFAVVFREDASPVVTLAAKNEQELLPSRNLRQQVRRGIRAAEKRGGGLSVVSDPRALPGLLETMMRLHNARFGTASSVFATPARRRFHLLAAQRLAAAGMSRMYRLTSDGADAGLLYAFALGQRLYYYSMGIAPEQTLSPGRTVLGQAVLSAASEGFEEFDLLRGDHDYKWRFADEGRVDATIRALRLAPRSAALAVPLALRHARSRKSARI